MGCVEILEDLGNLLFETLPFRLGGVDFLAFGADRADIFHFVDGAANQFLSAIEKLVNGFQRQGKRFAFFQERFRQLGDVAAV